MRIHLLSLVAGALVSSVCLAEAPLQISGVYPHLAVHNAAGYGECGMGAIVPWAGKIWIITYPPHMRNGSQDKLWEIDPKTLSITARPESVGGTHANRFIHRESKQLIIGPYFIDEKGTVRAADVKNGLVGRMTATARHLTDPANKVLFFDMEGPVLEADVHTLAVKKLFNKPVPGWHGKGAYSGQGVFIVANNGENPSGDFAKHSEWPAEKWTKGAEEAGVLAEWNGKDWKVILRRQFLDVTGPGGIYGPPEDNPDAPIWSFGWDKRSLILAVRDAKKNAENPWSFYRMPKASHAFDPKHGWFTEWPRIREIAPGRLMMVAHGMMFDFPKTFAPGSTAGIRPIATHLRYVPDFCGFEGKVILASDETTIMANPMAGVAQSNLWWGTADQLKDFGPAAGWGGVWMGDAVKAGVPSEPFLLAGFEKRVLHLTQKSGDEVKFTIEIDEAGDGKWRPYQTVSVPSMGYKYHVFGKEVGGEWVRIKADKDCVASAYFHYLTPSKFQGSHRGTLFASLAPAGAEKTAWTGGIIRPGKEKQLQFVSHSIDANGKTGAAVYYEMDENMALKKVDNPERMADVLKIAEIKPDYTVDEASVVVSLKNTKGEVRFRLPKGPAGFEAMKGMRGRGVREVESERFLADIDGTFYEIPRSGERAVPNFHEIKPVASHPFAITDFCTWRGLLVLAGNLADAKPDGHYFTSGDSSAGLWFGAVDDLWKLGKPVGRGGPWKNSEVKADEPSDAYLMTNYDKKRVELSHDASGPVKMTIEVDPTNQGFWKEYQVVTVEPGKTATHEFPDGFGAYWVRVKADKACKATATFIYE